MKQLVTPLLVLSFIAFILSCDDSFLEENKKVIDGYMLDTSLYVNPTNEFTEVSVTLPDQKNKDFKVVQYPTLIQFESLKGHIDEQGNLKFKIKVGDFETNVSLDPLELGHILLNISDFGMLSIPILHLNTGVSKANINNTSFDFGLSTRDKVELPYTVSEIEDGENGYYYLTNNEKEVFSYNTLTREIKKQEILTSGGHSIIEADMLVKAAGKSQLLLSRKNISPNGLYLVDFSDPENLSFIKYWHSGFGNRFFTSTDRDFIYSINNGHLYQFPNSDTANNLYDLGKFVPDQTNYDNFYGYNWFDHNMANSSVWASYNFRSIEKNAVIEFNDKTLERKRVVELNDYVTIIKGKKDYYKTLAHYIFSNSENDRLIVIKNVDEYNANAWHLEIVDISH